jgi:hypothetical protein
MNKNMGELKEKKMSLFSSVTRENAGMLNQRSITTHCCILIYSSITIILPLDTTQQVKLRISK